MAAKPVPLDYDTDPERFRANQQAANKYSLGGDVHEAVAERLWAESLEPVLDLGCGEGRLTRPVHARGMFIVALDNSVTMLAAVPGSPVSADASRLPFHSQAFKSVAALYMLYHLPDPRQAIAESYRLLTPGGLFVASAPSRYNDPELAHLLPSLTPATFDAENGPQMVREFFAETDVERWDGPFVQLPDDEALKLYLRGRGGLSEAEIGQAAKRVSVPLTLTKRGALIFGRKIGG